MKKPEEINERELSVLLSGVSAERELCHSVQKEIGRAGIYYRIFARIKSAHSLSEKLKLKDEKYIQEGRGLQDIIGIRIVLYYVDDIPVCQKIIEEHFQVLEEDSQIDVLKDNEFKPMRMNLVCRLPEDCIEIMPATLWKDYRIDKTFELQIRTIFSEGWHEVEHDVRYKHDKEWKVESYYEFNRNLNGIKATLEMCDNTIIQVLESLAYKCYKDTAIEEMFRYKFRIRLVDEMIRDELKEIILADSMLLKKFFRVEREEVLLFLTSDKITPIPRTLDNLIYICNEIQVKDKKIEEITPRLIKKNVIIWRQFCNRTS